MDAELSSGAQIVRLESARAGRGMVDRDRDHAGRGDSREAEVFGALYRESEPEVARLCRRVLGSSDAADDAASDVYLRARQSFESYRRDRPFRPWILAIAGHHCIDRLRRGRTEDRLFDPNALDAGEVAAPGPSPLNQLEVARRRGDVLAAIDGLEPKYRIPLVLRYYGELEYVAIAELLDLTSNQVGTLLFRAKRLLRRELGSAGGGTR